MKKAAKAETTKPGVNGTKVESIADRRAAKAAAAPRKGWKCESCNTKNQPAPADAVVEKCRKCGEPSPAQKLQIANALGNLGGGVNTADNVEEAARREEGLGDKKRVALPADANLPFPGGRFDSQKSWDNLIRQRGVVRSCERIYNDLAGQAKEARTTLEKEQTTLNTMIDVADEKRRTDAKQPYLKEAGDEAPTRKPCAWEREHPGRTCPICSAPTGATLPSLANGKAPESKDHLAAAEVMLHEGLAPLVDALRKVNIVTSTSALAVLPADDRDALAKHAAAPGVIPPAIVLTAHIAAEIDEHQSVQQNCTKCGERLWYRKSGAAAFAKDTFVMLTVCDGTAASKKPEPARRTLHTGRTGKTPQSPGTTT
jgi:hypothetical protein